jgi:hypothetical protein
MRFFCSPEQFALDPLVAPVVFNEERFNSKRKLKIGYYTDDKFFTASIACQRAVKEAVQKLEAMGHEVRPSYITL